MPQSSGCPSYHFHVRRALGSQQEPMKLQGRRTSIVSFQKKKKNILLVQNEISIGGKKEQRKAKQNLCFVISPSVKCRNAHQGMERRNRR
jgi:hypothetical protein